ncbi:MAG: hypothetical protein HDS58_04335 [Barnesiella sp.]|nr:hypothetical protein [Barnesiella sp.]MBD5246193.1 hypothetical protein [Barnesiella sp.]MBD5249307.1 hypothetical protein [Barnesiella sp.]MDE6081281.1 hypothetical protein [Muribaculaceae bacterium]
MNRKSIVISQRVINTINSLPLEDRIAISTAVLGEFVFGVKDDLGLSSHNVMLYAVIRQYIKHDSETA